MTEKERADAGTTSFRAGRTLPTSDRSTTLRCWMAPRCTTSCERGCTRHELSKELSLGSLDVEEPHSYKHVTCCQLHDASKLFSDSSVALAVVSVLLSRGSLEFGWKRSHPWCADKHISVVSHLFQLFMPFHRY